MNYTYDELLCVIHNELLPVYKKYDPGASLDELIMRAKKSKVPALCKPKKESKDAVL